MSLLFHVLAGAGTWSEHLHQLCGQSPSDSTLSERRAALPWTVFTERMRLALRPWAQKRHPQAFYRRWRLLAIVAPNGA